MKCLIVIFAVLCVNAHAEEKRIPRNLLGALPRSEYLQNELRLTKTQRTRLMEMYYQSVAPVKMLFLPEVAKQLNVTEAQKRKMREVRVQAYNKMRAITKNRQVTTAIERLNAMRAAEAKSNEDVLKVLTKQQTRIIEKLRGKPIDPKKIYKMRPDV